MARGEIAGGAASHISQRNGATSFTGGQDQHKDARATAIRYGLSGLLAFAALNAFGGGYYGMTGAPAVPREWLNGTPFSDYVLPGVILFGVVGGALLVAAVAAFLETRLARPAALAAGTIMLGWLMVEVAFIGYVSWMQPVTAAAGVLVMALARLLPSRHR